MKKMDIKKENGSELDVHIRRKGIGIHITRYRKVYAFLLCVITVLSLCATMAPIYGQTMTTIVVDSVSDVKIGETAWINITARTITDPKGIGSYAFNLTYNPSVVHVVSVRGGDAPFNADPINNTQNPSGWTYITAFSATPATVNNTILCRVELKAMTNDGSISPINLTVDELLNPDNEDILYTTINGTFATLDEVPPTITFDVSEGATIAGPDIRVNATLYDLSGINESSIKVMLNNTEINAANYTTTKINPATWQVTIHPDVRYYNFSLPAYLKINVSARDNSTMQNFNYSTVNVTVAMTGFFDFEPKPDAYINITNPTIITGFVNIINTTVKMYLTYPNGTKVNVTSDCTIGENNITYQATNLPEGMYNVFVNGTVKGTSEERSATWNFSIDITKPQIIYFSVSDSDGDGFNECREVLTITWNVSDPNFDYIEIRDLTHNVTRNSNNDSITWTSTYGNQEVIFKAMDKARNSKETTFHVYNNYVAYITSNTSISFGAIQLNKTAVMDLMNLSVSKVEFYGGREIAAPTISSTNRTFIIGGKLPLDTTITLDRNANATITKTYNSLPVYDPGTNLSFTITAPSVNRANVLLVQANSSRVDEFINGKPLNLTTLKKLLIDIKNNITQYAGDIYFFGEGGWAKAKIKPDGSLGSYTFYGTFYINKSSIKDTLNKNTVNLSSGFTPNFVGKNISLSPSEYELIAFSLDADRIGLIATLPLVVANSTETGNVSPTTVQKGESISVSFPIAEHTAAILIKNATYNIDVELNATTDDLNILKLCFTAPGVNLTNVELSYTYGGRTYKLIASFPTGYAKINAAAGNSVSINTSNLVPGTYILYAISEKDKKVEAIARHDVKIITLTSIEVTPSTATLKIGDTQQFTATAKDQYGNGMAGINITWTSSNPAVGTIDPPWSITDVNGKATTTFTALAIGTTMVNATNATIVGTASVTVIAPTPTPMPPAVPPGGGGVGGVPPSLPGVTVEISTTKSIDLGIAGRSYTVDVTYPGLAITELGFRLLQSTKDFSIGVQKISQPPADVEQAPGKIYSYLYIFIGLPSAYYDNCIIKFNVNRAWLTNQGVSENDIVLYVYRDDKWIALPTKIIAKNDVITYEATSTSFSIFAISTIVAPPVTPTPTPTPIITPTPTPSPIVTPTPTPVVVPPVIPWEWIIGIIIAIIVIAAIYYLYTKKKK